MFDAAKPWLDNELYAYIEKKKKKEEEKVLRIAKTSDKEKVEVVNMFDIMMRNAGIDPDKLKDK